jgi:hypothetical protein
MPKNLEILIAIAGLYLAWKMYQSSKPAEATKAAWQSFPGGIQIDPNGNYYVDGKLIWSPTAYGGAA